MSVHTWPLFVTPLLVERSRRRLVRKKMTLKSWRPSYNIIQVDDNNNDDDDAWKLAPLKQCTPRHKPLFFSTLYYFLKRKEQTSATCEIFSLFSFVDLIERRPWGAGLTRSIGLLHACLEFNQREFAERSDFSSSSSSSLYAIRQENLRFYSTSFFFSFSFLTLPTGDLRVCHSP